jgi:hypothetical protein
MTVTNNKDGKPEYYSFMPVFQNFGATRTDRFNAWYSIHYFVGNVPENWDFTKPETKLTTADIIIGPNSAPLLQPVTITALDVDNALKNSGSIIIWGHAEYSDVFSPKESRPMNFCFRETPTTNTTTGQIAFVPTAYRSDCNTSR